MTRTSADTAIVDKAREATRRAKVEKVLGELGLGIDDSSIEQMMVFLEAMCIFQERNANYRDAWKEQGWRGNLMDLRRKVMRLWNQWWHPRGTRGYLDNAVDLLNFTAFFLRNARAENEEGNWQYFMHREDVCDCTAEPTD